MSTRHSLPAVRRPLSPRASVGRICQADAAIVVEPMLVPEVNVQLRRLCETALTALPETEAGLRVRVAARRRLPLPRRPLGRACGLRRTRRPGRPAPGTAAAADP